MLIKAVLLDLDGTLLHTVPDLAVAINAMRKDFGLAELPLDTVARYVGKGAENLVHRSLTDADDGVAAPDDFALGMRLFHHHYGLVNGLYAELYPGVLQGLEQFAELGLHLAVVTNKPIGFTLPLLERTELSPWFSVVVGGDTCERKKPDPMMIHYACEQLCIEPHEALMIGDSVNDAQAARAANSPCWLLPYGYNEGRPVTQTPCDGIVNTLAHAAELLAAQR
jgi:phosphoglycolate phosphatase